MGYLIEYGMFLAKAVTIVIAIVIIISAISSSGGRQKKPGKKGSLKVSRLNDHLEEIQDIKLGNKKKSFLVNKKDISKILSLIKQGFREPLKTPDDTFIMVAQEKAAEIKKDQTDCMGCLSQCKFSSWKDSDKYSTGKLVDPRSFCIQKTLQNVAHDNEVDNELMFAGHNAWRFGKDPFYSNKFIPTVKQLIERIVTGE